tara:strand:+ start:52 stop:438 length:387 start_codon:yes stop_codon:yes gene_type:complete
MAPRPGYPKKSKPMKQNKPMKKVEKSKPMTPPMSPSTRRRIREAEGRMQQGQIGGNLPIDAGTDTSDDAVFSDRVVDKDKAFGMKRGRKVKKKGYAMGGAMKKKGMKKGGKVRGAGIARKGVRPAKMR